MGNVLYVIMRRSKKKEWSCEVIENKVENEIG